MHLRRNIDLKLALLEKNSQVNACKILNIHPSKLSGIIGGYIEASPELKRKICRYVQRPIEDLFPERN
jgi:hypothetical protein